MFSHFEGQYCTVVAFFVDGENKKKMMSWEQSIFTGNHQTFVVSSAGNDNQPSLDPSEFPTLGNRLGAGGGGGTPNPSFQQAQARQFGKFSWCFLAKIKSKCELYVISIIWKILWQL